MVEVATKKVVRPFIEAMFKIVEEILDGGFRYEGRIEVIFDLNEDLSPDEKEYGFFWIQDRIGASVDEALVRNEYISSDMYSKMAVFDGELGDGWYLAKWQDLDRQPIYFIVREEVLNSETNSLGMPVLAEFS